MTTLEERLITLLRPLGYQTGDCGYCKSDDSGERRQQSRASYYVLSRSILPEHYQELMDRGWRRSGTLLYLPDLARSCCPHYTIRLPAAEFQPSRDQRQALNRWNRFVLGENYIKEVTKRYPKSKEEKKRANVFNLCTTVHESESTNTKAELTTDHKLTVTLESDNFTLEKFQLFEDYQRNVHHESADEISRSGFKRFLCDSPLRRSTNESGKRLGSYHQCYRLDGRLIAMSVLDLLPHAVSGVYFIYHHDFEKWSMGKLSALREAALAEEAGYDFYYMGYYIHDCAKMKYKATYRQQYVLDCNTLTWDPLNDEMRTLMDHGGFISLSSQRRKITDEHDEAADMWILPTASSAVESEKSLLELGMPGILSLEDVREVQVEEIEITLGQDRLVRMIDLMRWDEGSELDTTSLRGMIVEYAACVGRTIATEAVIDFAR